MGVGGGWGDLFSSFECCPDEEETGWLMGIQNASDMICHQ